MIRVMLVDDHAVVRLGLRSYLETEDDIEIVAEASDGGEVLDLVGQHYPDVILMDLLMPKVSGIEATTVLRQNGVQVPIVILTSSLDDTLVIQALKAGALSYILKTSLADDVVKAVRAAANGQSVLDAQVQQRIVGGLRNSPESRPWEELTERERDVLKGIASGKNNQEIADDLGIGIKTVKTHVSNIFAKLGVLDRTQAAIYAIRHQLD